MGRESDVHMEVQTADWQNLWARISRYSFWDAVQVLKNKFHFAKFGLV